MNPSPKSQDPAPLAMGCIAAVCYPAFLLSIPCFLFGAIHVALCLWGVAGAAFFLGVLTNLVFGEHVGREKEPSHDQRIAYHREVHAKETVYYRPRQPEPSVEIPLSEYPPCKDPVTGQVYSFNELRERMLRERYGK